MITMRDVGWSLVVLCKFCFWVWVCDFYFHMHIDMLVYSLVCSTFLSFIYLSLFQNVGVVVVSFGMECVGVG